MKPGDRVVCIVSKDNWKVRGVQQPGPDKHEVVKIIRIEEHPVVKGTFGFVLEEYGNNLYNTKCFAPLDDDFAKNLLAEIAEEVEEEFLVPV